MLKIFSSYLTVNNLTFVDADPVPAPVEPNQLSTGGPANILSLCDAIVSGGLTWGVD